MNSTMTTAIFTGYSFWYWTETLENISTFWSLHAGLYNKAICLKKGKQRNVQDVHFHWLCKKFNIHALQVWCKKFNNLTPLPGDWYTTNRDVFIKTRISSGRSAVVLFEAFCPKFLLFLESQLEFLNTMFKEKKLNGFSLLWCICWDSPYLNRGQHIVGSHLLYLPK